MAAAAARRPRPRGARAPGPAARVAVAPARAAVVATLAARRERAAAMHDFCGGLPYGTLLVALGAGQLCVRAGGAATAGLATLAGGGAVLYLAAASLRRWRAGRLGFQWSTAGLAAAAAALAWAAYAGRAAAAGGAVRAALNLGVLASSAFFAAFFAYVALAGGNPPRSGTQDPAEG